MRSRFFSRPVGFLEVQPGTVTVLADTALRADDLDEVAAQQAKEHAEKVLQDQAADFEFSAAAAQLAEASARLRTAGGAAEATPLVQGSSYIVTMKGVTMVTPFCRCVPIIPRTPERIPLP